MNEVTMEPELETGITGAKKRGIRIEKPESIEAGSSIPSAAWEKGRDVASLSPEDVRVSLFFRFLLFLTYLFSAFALYLVFKVT